MSYHYKWKLRKLTLYYLNNSNIPYNIKLFLYFLHCLILYDRYEAEFRIREHLVYKKNIKDYYGF